MVQLSDPAVEEALCDMSCDRRRDEVSLDEVERIVI
jgi:hypothetical protein